MNWSKYQKDIFIAVENSSDSLIIEAVAGSGKTTTIVEAINYVPAGESVTFLAFNKSIADELGRRITRPGAMCQTLHAAGFAAWKMHLGLNDKGSKVDSGKVTNIIRELIPWKDRDKHPNLAKVIGYAKAAGIVPGSSIAGYSIQIGAFDVEGLVPDDDAVWKEMLEHFGIDPDEVDLKMARRVLWQSIWRSDAMIDFDDMLYMPVVAGAAFKHSDVVFLDEAQDVSGIQIEMVKRMVGKINGRVIAVGDPNQAIYGFRGALSTSMDDITAEFGSRRLPLSVSYRCPQEVVLHVQRWVPHIEYAPDSPSGYVGHEGTDWKGQAELALDEVSKWSQMEHFRPGDAILCRLTRPVVAAAFALIRGRIPCRMLGRDIGAGLIALIKKSKIASECPVSDFSLWMDLWGQKEAERLRERDEAAKLGALEDKLSTMRVFIDNLVDGQRSPLCPKGECATVGDLILEITDLFTDANGTRGMVTLSTVHKAKGLEFDRVFILDAGECMPCKWATQDWELGQERNLQYVAATRARRELRYIRSRELGIGPRREED